MSKAINTSYDALVRQIEKKEEKKEEKVFQKVQKQNRRELLEEYLLALVLQSKEPKHMIIKIEDILTAYEFEVSSIGKIFAEIFDVINAREFNMKIISKNLSKELLPTFDKCFLLPLPKFEDSIKYEEEVIRVSKDLRVLYLKERIKEIGRDLKNNKTADEIETLREEIAIITSQMTSN